MRRLSLLSVIVALVVPIPAIEARPLPFLRPATWVVDATTGRPLDSGADVTVLRAQASPRRRQRTADAERITIFGDVNCPEGFTVLFTGNVFAFQQKGVDPPQFGGVDPACWINPPREAPFLGTWTSVGDCVVCEPASSGVPTAPSQTEAPLGDRRTGAGGGTNGGGLPQSNAIGN